MDKKELVIENNNNVIDSTTGEILSIEKIKTVIVGKEPSFYKVYVEDLGNLIGLNNAQKAVFECLASNMTFQNIVVLIKPIKKIIAQVTGYSPNTITKVIDQLYKKGMIIREDTSVYRINPKYVAKGKWEDIKALRLVIDYTEQGREIQVEKVNSKSITFRDKSDKQQLDIFE